MWIFPENESGSGKTATTHPSVAIDYSLCYNLPMLLVQHLTTVFFVSFLASSVLAAQTNYFSFTGQDFLEQTRFVFVGKLVDKVSYRDTEAGRIFTKHVFQVSEGVKGEPGAQAEVIEYGGTVDGETVIVSHQASYVLGQEYLVFSYVDLLGHDRTFSGPVGRLAVVSAADGQKKIRLYPTHPLRQALKPNNAAVFMELDGVCNRIRNRLEEIEHAKK